MQRIPKAWWITEIQDSSLEGRFESLLRKMYSRDDNDVWRLPIYALFKESVIQHFLQSEHIRELMQLALLFIFELKTDSHYDGATKTYDKSAR